MLVLKDQTFASGKPLVYKCPETGKTIVASNWPGFIYKIKAHRHSNKLPDPLNFYQILQHNWCLDHPTYCREAGSKSPQPVHPGSARIPYPRLRDQLKGFVADATEWAKSGFKRTEKNLVEQRLGICTQCEFWSGGVSFWEFRCRKCGCKMKLKVAMATTKCPVGKW